MLIIACPKCGGFPEFDAATGGVLSCCYLATVRALNVATFEATPETLRGLWRWTAKYREAKRAEYAAARWAFAIGMSLSREWDYVVCGNQSPFGHMYCKRESGHRGSHGWASQGCL